MLVWLHTRSESVVKKAGDVSAKNERTGSADPVGKVGTANKAKVVTM